MSLPTANKTIRVYLLILLITGVSYSSYSDEGIDNDYVEKHISGFVNYSYIGKGLDSNQQNVQSLSFRFVWEDRFYDMLTLHVEFYGFHIRTKLVNEINLIEARNPYDVWRSFSDHDSFYIDDPIIIQKLNKSYTYTRFDEWYIQLDNDIVQWRFGNQKFVWGQSLPFSFINALLPLSEIELGIKRSAKDYLYPNLTSVLTFYPTPSLELGFYYFLNHNRDPITSLYGKQAAQQASHYFKQLIPTCPTPLTDRKQCTYSLQYGKVLYTPDEASQHAFRLVYHGAKNTIGFTYFDGYLGKSPTDYSAEYRLVEALPALPSSESPNPNTPLYNIQVNFKNGFAKIKAIAFEISSVLNDEYTIYFDYLRILTPTVAPIDAGNFGYIEPAVISNSDGYFRYNLIYLPPCAYILGYTFSELNDSTGCNKHNEPASGRLRNGQIPELDYPAFKAIIQNKGKLYSEYYYELFSLGFTYSNTNGFIVSFTLYGSVITGLKLPASARDFYGSGKEYGALPVISISQKYGRDDKELSTGFFGYLKSGCFGLGYLYDNTEYENIGINFFLALPINCTSIAFNEIYHPIYKDILNASLSGGHLSDYPSELNTTDFYEERTHDKHPSKFSLLRSGFSITYYF
ncbi:MAG: hypothetical protein QM538_07610 [Methylacidiphilales bacterium]|nr:hypothetical protein [Candidatus Methylacidiphilales bacterium]